MAFFVCCDVRAREEGPEKVQVGRKGAGVGREVFVWCELGGVDEEGEYCVWVLCERLAD